MSSCVHVCESLCECKKVRIIWCVYMEIDVRGRVCIYV